MLVQAILFLAAILVALLLWKLVKNIFVLAINSVIGIFAFFGFNYIFSANVTVNIWSVLITVIGGIFGFAAVIISHYLGWAF